MSENTLENNQATEATENTLTQESTKTYTQAEFDNHMAGLKKSLTSKFEKQFADLGDLNELKQLKTQAEQQKQEEAIKRGEFENILKSLADKKDAEIAEKNKVIEEYTVNTPLLSAAAQYKAVNPQQVVQLIRNQVRLGENGQAEVVDDAGQVRYNDQGSSLSVDALVQEFLQSNPHFVSAAPATTNTKSAVNGSGNLEDFDISKLDLSNPEHRKVYAQAKTRGLI
jgi:tyrosyl-tRNA synthetase